MQAYFPVPDGQLCLLPHLDYVRVCGRLRSLTIDQGLHFESTDRVGNPRLCGCRGLLYPKYAKPRRLRFDGSLGAGIATNR